MKKILAIKLRELGDTILWTSSLRAIRNAAPDAVLDAVVYEKAKDILAEEPYLSSVQLVPNGVSFASLIKRAWRWRQGRYDTVLIFHASHSLTRLGWSLGAKTLVMHHHSLRYAPWPSAPIAAPGFLQNAFLRDFEVLKAAHIPLPTTYPLPLTVTAKELREAKLKLAKVARDSKIVFLLPGASLPTKRLPLSRWETLVPKLKKEGTRLVMVADLSLSREWNLVAFCKQQGVLLFDDLSFRQVMALLSLGHAALGNDSSLIHLACHFGLKTLTLFGPTCFGDWHPYQDVRHQAARIDVPCRAQGPRDQADFQYCTLAQCSHLSCLQNLPISMIVEKCQHFWE